MQLSAAAWRASLLPASFAGVPFHVEQGSQAGGRRIALHEFPKKNTPYAEDMGRKARRWQIQAYLVSPDYLGNRDLLIDVCEIEGPGTLVHPTLGAKQVVVDSYSAREFREKGGYVLFEFQFTEAGQPASNAVTDDTQGQVAAAASSAQQAASSSLDTTIQKQLTFPGAAYGGGVSGPI
jgi:prophage DNA circulation protein